MKTTNTLHTPKHSEHINKIHTRAFPLIIVLHLICCFPNTTNASGITGSTNICVGASAPLFDSESGGIWSSGNPGIALIDSESGIFTGVAGGTAIISYTASGGTETIVVSVNTLPDPGTITGSSSLCVLSGTTLSDVITGGLWSANNGLATVGSTSGAVTGVATGTDSIKYTVTNSCGSAYASTAIVINGTLDDIYTCGGTGTAGYSGDGGMAFYANISMPGDMAMDSTGNLYVCDVNNDRVRKISTSGIISTVAGNGTAGNTGDGGLATLAELDMPNGIYPARDGSLVVCNTSANTVRKISPSGFITTIAGTGILGSGGDGGPAMAATLNYPVSALEDTAGNLYLSDQGNNKIRRIDASTGIITTVAGTGTAGYSGDGGPATAAKLNTVRGITSDRSGNIYIADALNNVVRKYVPSTGIITTFAGTGTAGHSGDDGPATGAKLHTPARVAYDGANLLYINDQSNEVIRQVNLATGIITQTAGNGTAGYSGDYGPSNSAQLHAPTGIATDHNGNFYLSDGLNNRVRFAPTAGSVAIACTGPTHIFAGSPITFNSFISVSGSLSYYWQKNGITVSSGGTTYTNPGPANGDVYRLIVRVVRECGSAFSDTSNDVTITVCPTVSPVSGTNSVCAGTSAALADSTPGGSWASLSTSVASVDSSGVISGISAGNSTIIYSAPSACGISSDSFAITVNPLPSVTGTVSDVTCNGYTDGNIMTSVSGGSSHTWLYYDYAWSNGATSNGLWGVAAGSYSVTATDPDGCAGTASFTVAQPAALTGTATVVNDSYSGASNGAINYSVTGGTRPYTYSWSDGETTENIASLPAAIYYVTTTDANSCNITDNYTVSQPTFDSSDSVSSITGDNVICAGSTTMLSDSTSGGTWSSGDLSVATVDEGTGVVTGIAPGTVSITYSAGTIASTVISVRPSPSVTGSVTNVTCYGYTDGDIAISVSGGSTSGSWLYYTYSWSNGATTDGLWGISSGAYSVTATDPNGCGGTTSFAVSQPDSMSGSAIVTNDTIYGGSTGSVYYTVTGGTGPYTYSWSTGATAENIVALPAGTYAVTTTDANSCSRSDWYAVSEPYPDGGRKSTGRDSSGSQFNVQLKATPNPFSTETTLTFSLPDDGYTTVKVYNAVSGREVETIFSDNVSANKEYNCVLTSGNLPCGLYLYEISTGDKIYAGKVVLSR